MADKRGSAFLLKLSDGSNPPVYRTVAGMRSTETLLEPNKATIRGAGIFLGNEAERKVRGICLTGELVPCELSYEDGSKIRADFLLTRLEYSGDYGGERNYALSMESAGEVEVA